MLASARVNLNAGGVMGMVGCFVAVSDADLRAVIDEPSRIHVLLGGDAPPPPQSFLARVFGGKRGSNSSETAWQPAHEIRDFDVDKAWQGIHFLLTGTDWEGTGPLAFILHGGTEIPEELGYGPPHGFSSSEVKTIAQALEPISSDALFERANREEFQKNSIYPEIWDEPKEECIGYVTSYFKDLKNFIKEAAASNSALIVYIG